jgi:hypothetical protein
VVLEFQGSLVYIPKCCLKNKQANKKLITNIVYFYLSEFRDCIIGHKRSIDFMVLFCPWNGIWNELVLKGKFYEYLVCSVD